MSDVEKVKEVVLELDRDGREGIVIKPISNGKQIKYVTLSSCLRDLQASSDLITELPARVLHTEDTQSLLLLS